MVSCTWCLEKRLDPECETNKLKKERKCNVVVLQSCSISLAQWSLRLQNRVACLSSPGSPRHPCKGVCAKKKGETHGEKRATLDLSSVVVDRANLVAKLI